MKAISLWQPWASLIACGAKPYETRSWAPPQSLIGQTIAIHAAKKIDKEAARFAQDIMYGQHPAGGFVLADKLDATMSKAPDSLMGIFGQAAMPVGCIVCTARLDGAFQLGARAPSMAPASLITRRMISRPVPGLLTIPHDDFGNYAEGRWAWRLTNVTPLNPPPPAKGAQGFFELPQGWMTGGAA